jgi:hypothetical protein
MPLSPRQIRRDKAAADRLRSRTSAGNGSSRHARAKAKPPIPAARRRQGESAGRLGFPQNGGPGVPVLGRAGEREWKTDAREGKPRGKANRSALLICHAGSGASQASAA